MTRVENLENHKVKLEIEIDHEDFEKALQKSYLKNVKSIYVPGFRKGKVPRKIIEKRFGAAIFYEDAINFACPPAYDKAMAENGFVAVEHPEIDIVSIGEDEKFVFSATVTIKPKIEIDEYKGLELAKIEYAACDDDVNKRLDELREQNARLISVQDRPSQKGDVLTIDFKGFVDGVPFDGGEAQGHQLELGSGAFIPGFEEQLEGKNIGDETVVTVKFPDDYHSSELMGKEAQFEVVVHEIKIKELPLLDDDFAMDVSDFDTLEEFKKDILQSLQKDMDEKAKNETENRILEMLCEKVDITLPEVMIDSQVDSMFEDFAYRLRMQGMTPERYAEMMGVDVEKIRNDFRPSAELGVKSGLVLEAIAKKEDLLPTDQERDEEIERICREHNMTRKNVENIFKRDQSRIDTEILTRKTIDFLLNNAVIN